MSSDGRGARTPGGEEARRPSSRASGPGEDARRPRTSSPADRGEAVRPLFVLPPAVEVSEELSFHLAMRERELRARGLSEAEARAEALRRFGDLVDVGSECRRIAEERNRTMKRAEWLTEQRTDIRYALRQLRRAPAFAAVAVLTLALGIGAATAIFSAVDAVLLQALPFPAADRLVVPHTVHREEGLRPSVGWLDYQDWRAAGVFESVALLRHQNVNVAGDVETERVAAVLVTEDYFATLQVAPLVGGLFTPADHEAGAPRRAVISHGLWQRRFGGDTSLPGRIVELGGAPVEIAGVLPAGLGYPGGVDAWLPLQLTPAARAELERRDNFVFYAVARLAAGAPLPVANAELEAIAARVAQEEPATRAKEEAPPPPPAIGMTALPLSAFLVGETAARTLWLLLGAVTCVLLIGCVNVANLLLGRAAARARELNLRSGLGASRGRLVRQLLTEGVVLALLGGALGVALAAAGVRVLTSLAPGGLPNVDAISLNATVLGFALAVSLASALLFAVLPALRASRSAGHAPAGATSRATADIGMRRRREALVAAQLALSLVLLVGAGLLLRSLVRLTDADPGFETGRMLVVAVSMQGPRYTDQPEARAAAFIELRERLEALPGVRAASYASSLPLGGGGLYLGRAFLAEGAAEPPAGADVRAMWSNVGPRYFETMGVRMLRGRGFTEADHAAAPPVAVISRAFARSMFGDADPIGRRVRSWRDENVYREIVGVVDDVRLFGVGDEVRPLFYVPHAQDAWSGVSLIVRTAGEPLLAASQVRGALSEFDRAIGIASVGSMDEVFGASVAQNRFAAILVGIFAAIALVLALVGIYGVLSSVVTQRTREIGIRIAVGARPAQVLRLVLGEAAVVIAAGLALGVPGAVFVTRLAESLLYDVSATDPVTFAAVATLLTAAAFAASAIPSRRAANVDPMTTLRSE
jgi:predicted permease